MEEYEKKEFLIRGILILIGIVFFIFGFYVLFKEINPLIQSFLLGNLNFSAITVDWTVIIFLLIIGYIVFIIGKDWKNFLKGFSSIFISVAILCLTISIIFYSINSHSEDLVDSIQPSLDLAVADSFGDLIENQIEIKEDEQINLILGTNIENDVIYNENLTKEDAKKFDPISDNFFGETTLNSEQKIKFAQMIITQIYNNLSVSNPELLEAGIPISTLESISEQQIENFDQILLDNIDSLGLTQEEELLLSFLSSQEIIQFLKDEPDLFLDSVVINEDAYVNIIVAENEEIKKITIGNINEKDLNLIWKNLGLNKTSSIENRKKIADIILSFILTELENQNLEAFDVPLSSLSNSIPQEFENILNYEFFGNDTQKKQESLVMLREDCKENDLEELEEICEGIMLTEYENLMSNFNEVNQMSLNQTGNKLLPFEFDVEKIDTIDELKNIAYEKTNSWGKYLFFSILFFIFAIGIYFAHYKFFEKEINFKEIFYNVSKLNLFQFIPAFILVLLIYLFIVYGGIFDSILNSFIDDKNLVNVISNLEIFKVFFEIFNNIFFLHLIYLILSTVIFVIFFILVKKQDKNYQI